VFGIKIAKKFAQSGHLVIGPFGNPYVLALKLPEILSLYLLVGMFGNAWVLSLKLPKKKEIE
jgi:hypothetical protein